ncbi:MAG TPA: hypothetical protein VFG08_05835, partial [Candidatus Polarisedimenticolia bacterium]|nr:hypothetical protein [Candidatus Polarisedimenticolia bacterium]
SVVVTIVDGGKALQRCLSALAAQELPPPLEVLVPYDATVAGIDEFRRTFPHFLFLDIGGHQPKRAATSPAGQHELFDVRRAAGLRRASGGIIAMVEDRGVPRSTWAAGVIRAHARIAGAGAGAIGGAVENGRDGILNWAVYFCDFARYQLPFEEGPAAWITDVNLSYRREVLQRARRHWQDRYHESTLHWNLRRQGEELWISPELVVDQHRDNLTIGSLLVERFAWGRLFAFTRAREISPAARIGLALLSPLLPALFFLRLLRLSFAKRRNLGRLLRAAPVTLLLLTAWSLGELVGYVTGTE